MRDRVLAPFLSLPPALRAARFPVSPDQTMDFLAGVGALGPRDIDDVYRAARALFAIPPERVGEFDAIFRAIFFGQSLAADATGEEGDETLAVEPTGERVEIELDERAEDEPGEMASAAERLSARALAPLGDSDTLAAFSRDAPHRLPRRRTRRRAASKRGDRIDLRRTLRAALRQDGEIFTLPRSRRRMRQRPIVLMVDVSGSMKERSEAHLQLGHALAQAADRAEIFTLGTRLTRITSALAPADRAQALARVAATVADFDGGTRIGEALQAFLSVPRYAGLARGALVVLLSDGLERGAPDAMADAVARLSRLAWRLHWLTPLAADPDYRPETEAMRIVAPMLDALEDGSSVSAITAHLLSVARAA